MALTSPGVQVTINDQSQYLPAPTNSVPLIILATAQNKADGSGTAVASATTAANANKLYQVTSQRDLVNLYGVPFFYTTTNGTPIQGYELNEYGLLAAYSVLGASNRCYVLRADIDLASLVGQTGRPVGSPDNGTYWLDSTTSAWGIYEFNATTSKFVAQTPIVITDTVYLSAGAPVSSVGNIGDYAVVANAITTQASATARTYYRKNLSNVWNPVGSADWQLDLPTAQATGGTPTFPTAAGTFTITVTDGSPLGYTTTISVASQTTVTALTTATATAINAAATAVTASVIDGKLNLFSAQNTGMTTTDPAAAKGFTIGGGTGTLLADLGLSLGTYYQPAMVYGTSAQMPYWTSSQTYPRPTGSVWIKVGAAGLGLAPVVASYSSTSKLWVTKTVALSTSDWASTYALDSTGGQAIPANSVYAQYGYDNQYVAAPVYLWRRSVTGPTIVTGSTVNTAFAVPYPLTVQVSAPGSSALSSSYSVTIPVGGATDFIQAWTAANIPYTTATVTSLGAIQLTHTQGGEIIISDFVAGVSNGCLALAGFVSAVTTGCKPGPAVVTTFLATGSGDSPSTGVGAQFNVTSAYGAYTLDYTYVVTAGTGFLVGDTITILGSALGGADGTNDLVVEVTTINGTGGVTALNYVSGTPSSNWPVQLSNWQSFTYTANEGAPTAEPANDTNWFYSVINEVDIMVQQGGSWKGYGTVNYDSTGAPSATGSNSTDPSGPIISASAPSALTGQSDGTALAYGDLWIDTSDLENYPIISRWQQVDSVDMWVLLDNADQVSSRGVTFLDARWATNGTTSPTDDPIPSIVSLLTSDYLDLDAPEPTLYPQGMLLFNTRRSGYNVKQFKSNYFNSVSFPGATLPTQTSAWVTASGLMSNGAPYMGRKAQRAMVVKSLNAAVTSNLDIRDEDNFFNLIAAPNYPELQPTMVVLNSDRGETAYIVGDTPMRLKDSATEIQAWATNAAGAASTGEAGCVTRNTFLGLFYPSGLTNDLSGNLVAVPSSHMMLRTFLHNDTVAYPWLAAAGTRRGTIDNATNIGYLDSATGEFVTIKTRLGIRDVLYINFINPMVFFTGVGLLNYGNKTSYNSTSALDRTNVARLVAYVRHQMTIAARPFVFEPNDALTRQQIAAVIQTLMVDLVAKRGIYDYIVVCDETNNTPARIDRNELWVDVGLAPTKAAEFIFIPVRIVNTGSALK
jgi:hypothetical protein